MKRKPIDTFEPTKEQVNDLRDGLQQPFWLALRAIIEDERKDAETALFDENGLLNHEQREDWRQRRNLLQYVLELPEAVIAKMEPKRKQKEENPAFEE